jgi:hypothetical protein
VAEQRLGGGLSTRGACSKSRLKSEKIYDHPIRDTGSPDDYPWLPAALMHSSTKTAVKADIISTKAKTMDFTKRTERSLLPFPVSYCYRQP